MSARRWKDAIKTAVQRMAPGALDFWYARKVAGGERTYSQEGEDRVLSRYFDSVHAGFFVDVGAHHPMRFSNTFLFYLRGWRGVNIDAMPGSMRLFDKYRPGDTNIEVGISVNHSELPFYVFNEPALNSFDEFLSKSRENGEYKITDVVKVPVRPLREVIGPYLPSDKQTPSFLTVDVEGRDLDVLQSNDWTTFRPTFVLSECLGATCEDAALGEVNALLRSHGYTMVAKTANTALYRAEEIRYR